MSRESVEHAGGGEKVNDESLAAEPSLGALCASGESW